MYPEEQKHRRKLFFQTMQMTQEEENLCQRANQLRRKSEVTFKTIDPTK